MRSTKIKSARVTKGKPRRITRTDPRRIGSLQYLYIQPSPMHIRLGENITLVPTPTISAAEVNRSPCIDCPFMFSPRVWRPPDYSGGCEAEMLANWQRESTWEGRQPHSHTTTSWTNHSLLYTWWCSVSSLHLDWIVFELRKETTPMSVVGFMHSVSLAWAC